MAATHQRSTSPVSDEHSPKRAKTGHNGSTSSDSDSASESDAPVQKKKAAEAVDSGSDSESSASSEASLQAPEKPALPPDLPYEQPPFLPAPGQPQRSEEEERAAREKFKQFWMGSVADTFSADLEVVRKVRPGRPRT